MARGTPEYNSGQIAAAGSGNIAAFMAMLETEITAYQSNGEDAWELADEIATGANYEKVFHSVGDRSLGSGTNKGDTDIWVYIHLATVDDIVVRAAQDYSPTTGVWSTGAYHEAGTSNWVTNLVDTQQIDWWRVSNEYEFVFVYTQGGIYHILHFGQVIRPYTETMNGVARITSVSGTGNNITVGLDRDISSKIQDTQYAWMVNQTPDATGLQSVGLDRVVVNSIGASSANVDGVVGTFAVGSLFGLDPHPVFCRTTNTTTHMISEYDGTWTGATGQGATPLTLAATLDTDADCDPDINGLYHGYRIGLKMSSAPILFRGNFELYRIWSKGAQSDGDVMVIEYDSANRWTCFAATPVAISATVCGIGPGAP